MEAPSNRGSSQEAPEARLPSDGVVAPVSEQLTNIEERVPLLEQARDNGFRMLDHIHARLKKMTLATDASIQSWSDQLENTKSAVKRREALVGIVGETGYGKSTTVNTLLDMEIAPTHAGSACTAAVCVYMYNDDPDTACKATITYKSRDSVEKELDAFLEELDDLSHGIDEQGLDAEVSARIKQSNKQLKVIQSWSGLPETAIKGSTADEIAKNSKVKALALSKGSTQMTKRINANGPKELLKLLRPYIDSSASVRNAAQQWPLVEQVEIRVKAKLLRHGLKIVDLPGIMDSLDSRASVAQKYMGRLEKRIVVTHAVRGADSKATADLLLPSADMVELELDDKFSADSLAVIITKIDDLEINNAAEEWPEADGIEGIEEAFEDLQAKLDELKEEMTELGEQTKGGTQTGEDEEEAVDGQSLVAVPAKRRQPGEGLAEEEAVADDQQRRDKEFARLRDRCRSLEREVAGLKFERKRLCIRARNKRLVQDIREDLRDGRAQACSSKGTSDMQDAAIFPVSSIAYGGLKKGQKPEGFPDPASTGIPALQDWLIQGSLSYREESVISDIQRQQILFDGMDGWTHDDSPEDRHLPPTQKKQLVGQVLSHVASLDKDMKSKVRDSLSSKLSRLRPLRDVHLGIKNRASAGDSSGIERAIMNFTRAADGWQYKDVLANALGVEKRAKLHYLTYRACVKRNGGVWRTRARDSRRYHWMGTIITAFWRGHLDAWRDAFHRKLPSHVSKAQGSAQACFDKFTHSLLSDPEIPEPLREILRQNMYQLLHILEVYQGGIKELMDEFRLTARGTKVKAEELLTATMRPGFELAKAEKGLNSHKRQLKCVAAHVDKVEDGIFLNVCNEIEEILYKHTRENSKAIQHLWSGDNSGGGDGSSKPVSCYSQQLRVLLKRLVGSVCAPTRGASTKTRNVTASTEADEQLKKNIRGVVAQWRKEWEVVDKRLPPRPKFKTFDDECDDEKDEKPKAARKGGQKRRANTTKKTDEGCNTGDEAAQETNQDADDDEDYASKMDVDARIEAECPQNGDVANATAKNEDGKIECDVGQDSGDPYEEKIDGVNETCQGDGEAQRAQGIEDQN